MLIPSRAVAYVLGSNKVFVVKDGVVDARDVTLGDRFETEVEIMEGLQVGETVAASGLNRLDAGVKVRIGEAKGEGRGRGGGARKGEAGSGDAPKGEGRKGDGKRGGRGNRGTSE
jgi:hypothetical protein